MPIASDVLNDFTKLDPLDQERVLVEMIHARSSRPWPTISDHPGVVKTPNVCGGAARIIRTRIPVWTLERMRQLGISESDILRSYPSLRAIDLVQAWSYADAHAEEIARLVRENEEE